MPEQKKPKHEKKLRLHPLTEDEVLRRILQAGPHPKRERQEPPPSKQTDKPQ